MSLFGRLLHYFFTYRTQKELQSWPLTMVRSSKAFGCCIPELGPQWVRPFLPRPLLEECAGTPELGPQRVRSFPLRPLLEKCAATPDAPEPRPYLRRTQSSNTAHGLVAMLAAGRSRKEEEKDVVASTWPLLNITGRSLQDIQRGRTTFATPAYILLTSRSFCRQPDAPDMEGVNEVIADTWPLPISHHLNDSPARQSNK